MVSLFPTDFFVTAAPIAIIGAIYYLVARFRRRGLSRRVHVAFVVTLTILMIWGAYLLVMVATGGGFSRLIYFDWATYFLPVTIGSFSLGWSVVTLWDFRTQSGDVAVRAISRVQAFMALIIVALAMIALSGYGYREHQLGVASNNNIAPERLRTLYHSRFASLDGQVAKRLAVNTATPVDVLQQLAVHDDINVRARVCRHPATPLSVLSVFANGEEQPLRSCVPMHSNASTALLAQLAGDESTNVRQAVAQNPATPPELLLKLSHDSQHYVLTTLVHNKATPAAALAILATSSEKNVRILVAARPDLPLQQQLLLAEDKLSIVRGGLLSKRVVPREVLAKLKNDPDKMIRRRVQEGYDYYERLERLGGKNLQAH